MADEKRMIGSLGDLVGLPGMPSEPTLRKMIKENPDFPILSQGKNGIAYEFDIAAAIGFIKSIQEKEQLESRSRADEIRQYGLELLGADAAADSEKHGLSISERKQLLEEEFIAIKVAERRGDLIRKISVEQVLSEILIRFRERGRTFTNRLAKRIDLPRETIASIDDLITSDLAALADELEGMADLSDDSCEDKAITAV